MRKLNLLRSESGTSLIELALVLPVLAFLLLGLIEVGRYAYYAIVAANAARAGVQYGAQGPQQAYDTTGMQSAAIQDAMGLSSLTAKAWELCSQSGSTPAQCATGTAPAPGNVYYVKVQVTGTFKSLIGYPGIPTNIPVSGSAIMRVIYQ
jgi:Flp pilus assembly protein TadG